MLRRQDTTRSLRHWPRDNTGSSGRRISSAPAQSPPRAQCSAASPSADGEPRRRRSWLPCELPCPYLWLLQGCTVMTCAGSWFWHNWRRGGTGQAVGPDVFLRDTSGSSWHILSRWHHQLSQMTSDGDGQYTGGSTVGPFWARSVCGHCRGAHHVSAVRPAVQGSSEPESGWWFSPSITGVHVSRCGSFGEDIHIFGVHLFNVHRSLTGYLLIGVCRDKKGSPNGLEKRPSIVMPCNARPIVSVVLGHSACSESTRWSRFRGPKI